MAMQKDMALSDPVRRAIRWGGQPLTRIATEVVISDGILSRVARGLTGKMSDRIFKYLGLELRGSKRKGG